MTDTPTSTGAEPRQWNAEKDADVERYTKLVHTYGADVRALNWGSQQSQERRFEILCSVGDLNGRSVLDVGCGTGDLYRWMANRGISAHYTGVDITPAMVETARERFPGTRFEVRDILQDPSNKYDYVFASGIFTYRKAGGDAYVHTMVRRMFEMSTIACAFNCLSRWGTNHGAQEYFADPVQMLFFARSLSEKLVLRHDYHPRDFTLYLYAPEPR